MSQYDAKFQQGIIVDRVEIILPSESVIITKFDIKTINVVKSVSRYVDQCQFAFDATKYSVFDKLDSDTRIKVFGIVSKDRPVLEVFHGFVFKTGKEWDKRLHSDLLYIAAKGLPYILAKELILEYELTYTNGFGEVISNLLKPFPIFDLTDVLGEFTKGRVYFNNISILDALRYLAYLRKWCLSFEGKSISFKPCETKVLEGNVSLDEFDRVSISKRIGK